MPIASDAAARATQVHATARRTEALIRRRIAEVSEEVVGASLQRDGSQVSRWLSGGQGVPLALIADLCGVLALSIIATERLWLLRHVAAERLLDDTEL